MKRFVLRLLGALVITAVVGFAFAVIPSVPTSEKEYEISDARVSVELQDDGSVIVHETLPFDFTGSFTGAYRDFPLNGNARVTDATVSENGQDYRPGADTDAGLVRPAGQLRNRESQERLSDRLALRPGGRHPHLRPRLPGRQRRDDPQRRRRRELDRLGGPVGLLAERPRRRDLGPIGRGAGAGLVATPIARRRGRGRRRRDGLGRSGARGRERRLPGGLSPRRDQQHRRRRGRIRQGAAGDRG